MVIKLCKRLKKIYDMANRENVIADIATDHGYLAVEFLLKDKAQKVIATDISEKSLSKCKLLAEKLSLSDRIDLRLGDGLALLNENEADLIIISGLGGLNIIKMLDESYKCSKYIFAPQNNAVRLREKIYSSQLVIIKDVKVLDKGIFYDIIYAEKGNASLSEYEKYWDKNTLENKDFELYCNKIKDIAKKVKAQSPCSKKDKFFDYILGLLK